MFNVENASFINMGNSKQAVAWTDEQAIADFPAFGPDLSFEKSIKRSIAVHGDQVLTYGDFMVDEAVIVEQMGHADIHCTKQYYYFSNKNREKTCNQLQSAINY